MTLLQFGYDFIQRLKRELHCTVPDSLALAAKNDPFYAGGKASRRQAEWFAALWERFRFPRGVHLRRIHYQVVSPGDVQKPDGNAVDKDSEALAISLPVPPEPKVKPDKSKGLLDSALDYLEQLKLYKLRKEK